MTRCLYQLSVSFAIESNAFLFIVFGWKSSLDSKLTNQSTLNSNHSAWQALIGAFKAQPEISGS
jgi:hypothetical protein